jgi:AbrB family looped-hinge helix DNA binding protein
MSEPILRIVTVSEKGQISIPQEIRKQLAVEKGSKLIIALTDNRLLIHKVSDVSQSMEDGFDDVVRYSEMSLKNIWDNEEDEVWNMYLKA